MESEGRRTIMASTDLSKGNNGKVARPTDVFGAMREEMDRLLGRFERGWPAMPGRMFESDAMVPSLDVHDDGKQLTIEADLPGVDEKDVTVTLANGLLTIKGEKKSEREEKDKSYYLAERSYGAFERSLRLPDTIDESRLEARFEKGVLKVSAPKKPEAIKAEKRIEIRKG
jgi:HSP20 family protein